jgi:hypothetical protein
MALNSISFINQKLSEFEVSVNHYLRMTSQIATVSMQIEATNQKLYDALKCDAFAESYKYHLQLTVLEAVRDNYTRYANELSAKVIKISMSDNGGSEEQTIGIRREEDANSVGDSMAESDSDSDDALEPEFDSVTSFLNSLVTEE